MLNLLIFLLVHVCRIISDETTNKCISLTVYPRALYISQHPWQLHFTILSGVHTAFIPLSDSLSRDSWSTDAQTDRLTVAYNRLVCCVWLMMTHTCRRYLFTDAVRLLLSNWCPVTTRLWPHLAKNSPAVTALIALYLSTVRQAVIITPHR